MQANVIIRNRKALQDTLALCQGSYQRGLVRGYYCLSGADLQGKAKRYGARYALSRRNLLQRLDRANLAEEVTGQHRKRILVIDYFTYSGQNGT